MFRACFLPVRRFTVLLITLLLAFTSTIQAATPPSNSYATQRAQLSTWQTITNEEEGFQLTIPAQWQALNLSPSEVALSLEITGAQNQQLPAFFQTAAFQQLIANGMKFYAIDLSAESLRYDFPASVNLVKLDLGGELPLTTLQKLNERQLATLAEPEYTIQSEIVSIHGHEAILFHYVLANDFGFAEPQLTAINQLLLVQDSSQFILTIGVPLAALADYSDAVLHILESFDLLAESATLKTLLLPTAIVQIAKLNVRSGPGTTYAILGGVSQNDRLPVTGRPRGRCDWFQVQLPSGQQGWIAGPPKYATLEGNCNDVPEVPVLPPPPTRSCVRFDNHFNKVADVTLTTPSQANWNLKFNVAPHGQQTQCLTTNRYTFSVGVPGEGSVNGEFMLEKGQPLLVLPIYQEFN